MLIIIVVCMMCMMYDVWVQVSVCHSVHVEVRGQLCGPGINGLVRQAPVPTEPSLQLTLHNL